MTTTGALAALVFALALSGCSGDNAGSETSLTGAATGASTTSDAEPPAASTSRGSPETSGPGTMPPPEDDSFPGASSESGGGETTGDATASGGPTPDGSSTGASSDCGPLSGAVNDGSFEGGTPSAAWSESSTNFSTPICDSTSCGAGGASGPHSGRYWVWIGGSGADEAASVDQDVVIPASATELRFQFQLPAADGDGADRFEVSVDGQVVFEATDLDHLEYAAYTEIIIEISDYADDASHNIRFAGSTTGGFTNFFVDDVTLC